VVLNRQSGDQGEVPECPAADEQTTYGFNAHPVAPLDRRQSRRRPDVVQEH